MFARLPVCLLTAALFIPAASVSSASAPAPKPGPEARSAAAGAAVLLSLDEFFGGKWSHGKVYVEAHELIPAQLARVGKYEAEVISKADLIKRFEGREVAPALASVSLNVEKREGEEEVYSVSISYTGVSVKGAKAIPLGGGKTYWYKVRDGKVELIKTATEHY